MNINKNLINKNYLLYDQKNIETEVASVDSAKKHQRSDISRTIH